MSPFMDIADAWVAFISALKESGARVTQSRKAVFCNVMHRDDHFTAEQLAAELTSGTPSVSRGTVYRTLTLMEEKGFVRSFRECKMHYKYEKTIGKSHHEHIVCECCGQVLEFCDPDLHAKLSQVCVDREFEEHSHSVVILGICKQCLLECSEKTPPKEKNT